MAAFIEDEIREIDTEMCTNLKIPLLLEFRGSFMMVKLRSAKNGGVYLSDNDDLWVSDDVFRNHLDGRHLYPVRGCSKGPFANGARIETHKEEQKTGLWWESVVSNVNNDGTYDIFYMSDYYRSGVLTEFNVTPNRIRSATTRRHPPVPKLVEVAAEHAQVAKVAKAVSPEPAKVAKAVAPTELAKAAGLQCLTSAPVVKSSAEKTTKEKDSDLTPEKWYIAMKANCAKHRASCSKGSPLDDHVVKRLASQKVQKIIVDLKTHLETNDVYRIIITCKGILNGLVADGLKSELKLEWCVRMIAARFVFMLRSQGISIEKIVEDAATYKYPPEEYKVTGDFVILSETLYKRLETNPDYRFFWEKVKQVKGGKLKQALALHKNGFGELAPKEIVKLANGETKSIISLEFCLFNDATMEIEK